MKKLKEGEKEDETKKTQEEELRRHTPFTPKPRSCQHLNFAGIISKEYLLSTSKSQTGPVDVLSVLSHACS